LVKEAVFIWPIKNTVPSLNSYIPEKASLDEVPPIYFAHLVTLRSLSKAATKAF
jgi:hypothetical protein